MSETGIDKNHSHSNIIAHFWHLFISLFCVCFISFQLFTAAFWRFPNLIQRSIHAGFCLVLCFILLPASRGNKTSVRPTWFNVLLSLISAFLCIYIVINYDRLMESIGIEAKTYEIIFGILLILLILESARRATGILLPLLTIATIAYTFLGKYIPGYWGHSGFGLQYIVEYLYLGAEGIWGILTGVSATLVAIFIIFGAFLLNTGGAESFMKIALLAGGRTNGGGAKVATVASALFGMLSGSAIANVATTGNFTIPMMKKLGYKNYFAAAVEATASSGGQITPPIMATGAFIMSELTGIPYLRIVLAGIIPAFVFYTCVWVSIDLEARKYQLKKVPANEIPSLGSVFKWNTTGPLFITILVLFTSMLAGHTPTKAGALSVITNLILFFFFTSKISILHKFRAILKAIEAAGHSLIKVASLLFCAQISISMICLSGLGIKISEMIMSASADNVLLALILAAVVCIVLGMGIPSTAAYVLAASVVGPALNMMNVDILAAHMFIFYCAIISCLTPPVCTAVYTASAIAEANWIKVAGVSMRLAIMKYIIPFLFVYRPSILCIFNGWKNIILTVIVTWISAYLFAIGSVGYYRDVIHPIMRLLTLLVAFSIIIPNVYTDIFGIIFMGGFIVWQRFRPKKIIFKN